MVLPKADNTTTNEMDDLFGAVSDSESDTDLSAEESSPMEEEPHRKRFT